VRHRVVQDAFSWPAQNADISFRAIGYDVPEPGALALFGTGLAGLGAMPRRRGKHD
jgi:hypothetical protein